MVICSLQLMSFYKMVAMLNSDTPSQAQYIRYIIQGYFLGGKILQEITCQEVHLFINKYHLLPIHCKDLV